MLFFFFFFCSQKLCSPQITIRPIFFYISHVTRYSPEEEVNLNHNVPILASSRAIYICAMSISHGKGKGGFQFFIFKVTYYAGIYIFLLEFYALE